MSSNDLRKYIDLLQEKQNIVPLEEKGFLSGLKDRFMSLVAPKQPEVADEPDEDAEEKAAASAKFKDKASTIYRKFMSEVVSAGIRPTVKNIIIWLHDFPSLQPDDISMGFQGIGIDAGTLPVTLAPVKELEPEPETSQDGDLVMPKRKRHRRRHPRNPETKPTTNHDATDQKWLNTHDAESEEIIRDGGFYTGNGKVVYPGYQVSVLVSPTGRAVAKLTSREAKVGTVQSYKKQDGTAIIDLGSGAEIMMTSDQIDAGFLQPGTWTKEQMIKWISENPRQESYDEIHATMMVEAKYTLLDFSDMEYESLVEDMTHMAAYLLCERDVANQELSKAQLTTLFEILLYIQAAKARGYTADDVVPHEAQQEFVDEYVENAFKTMLEKSKQVKRKSGGRIRRNAISLWEKVKPTIPDTYINDVNDIVRSTTSENDKGNLAILVAFLIVFPPLTKLKHGQVAKEFLKQVLDLVQE